MQVCGCSENRQYRWKVRWYLRDPETDQAINYAQNRACFRSVRFAFGNTFTLYNFGDVK